MNGHNIISCMTGYQMVYPGHPLVLATTIMQVFQSFEEANKPTVHGWCEALADSRIPGAGDHVGADMRVLKLGADGYGTEEMIQCASDYWGRGNAGGHHKNVADGQAQAAMVETSFRELAKTWF